MFEDRPQKGTVYPYPTEMLFFLVVPSTSQKLLEVKDGQIKNLEGRERAQRQIVEKTREQQLVGDE